jgi:large subunit ribosomal protein L15
MELSDLRAPDGAFTSRKRVGRGAGSGTGKTSGRGQKGQKARSGHHYMARHFEGGQTPIQQQLPYKRGFKNRFRIEWAVISLDRLAALDTDAELTPDLMVSAGLLRDTNKPIKILGGAEAPRAMRVSAHRFTASARQAIEAAGGQVTVLGEAAQPEGEAS